MSMDVFSTLHFLPDPIPDDDGHYKSLLDVYGQNTSEEHRPSLQATMKKTPKQSFGFSPSQQNVQNVGLLVQCKGLICRHKLNYQEAVELGRALDEMSYTCGVSLSDLKLPGRLKNVGVRDHKCRDPMEKLFYSCGFELASFPGSPPPRAQLLRVTFEPVQRRAWFKSIT